MENKENNNRLMDLINIIALLIGLRNLEANNKQILDLHEHLNKQDEILDLQNKRYEEIIELLKADKNTTKGE